VRNKHKKGRSKTPAFQSICAKQTYLTAIPYDVLLTNNYLLVLEVDVWVWARRANSSSRRVIALLELKDG